MKARKWTEFEDAALTRDYGKVPTKQIAIMLGRTFSSVAARAKVLCLSTNGVRAKWTTQAIRDRVMELYCDYPMSQVEEMMGLSFSTTRHIIASERKRAA